MTSPRARDVRVDGDVIKEHLVEDAGMHRTRGFNESFRAAVDRSYTNRQSATLGEMKITYVIFLHLNIYICPISTLLKSRLTQRGEKQVL